MTKWMLAAGAAALAIVSPALADPGGDKGKGQGQSKGQSAKADRGHGGGDHAMKADRGKDGARDVRVERKAEQRVVKREDRGSNKNVGARNDRDDRDVKRDRDIRVVDMDRDRFVPRWNENGLMSGFIDGCPPGLAKKGNGCMPPGQAKKLVGTLLPPRCRTTCSMARSANGIATTTISTTAMTATTSIASAAKAG